MYAYQLYTKTGAWRFLNDNGCMTSKLPNARRFTDKERREALMDGSFTATMPGKFVNFPTWEEMPTTVAQFRSLCPGFFKQRMKRDDKKFYVKVIFEIVAGKLTAQSFLLIHRCSKSSQNFDMHIFPVYLWLPEEKDIRFQAHFDTEMEASEWRKSGMAPKDFLKSQKVPI